MKGQTIFITGIAGFIGYHVALRLVEAGYTVSGCDNMNLYYDIALKKERKRLLEKAGVKVHVLDLSQDATLAPLFSKERFDYVLHLAAQAGVRYSTSNPLAYVDSNIRGFVNVLEVVKNQGAKLIYASSSSVYGNVKRGASKETDLIDSPFSIYAATKASGELIAKAYHNMYGIAMYGLRFFTVYGPFGRPDMAYFSFAEKILNGEPIQVFNQGKMERCFTYIDDIVQGILGSVRKIDEGEFELFNLGGDRTYRLDEMISSLEKHLGVSAKKVYEKAPLGDVEKTCSDITKAKKCFGYSPKTRLDEGLALFCHWMKAWHTEQKGQKSLL